MVVIAVILTFIIFIIVDLFIISSNKRTKDDKSKKMKDSFKLWKEIFNKRR